MRVLLLLRCERLFSRYEIVRPFLGRCIPAFVPSWPQAVRPYYAKWIVATTRSVSYEERRSKRIDFRASTKLPEELTRLSKGSIKGADSAVLPPVHLNLDFRTLSFMSL